MLCKNTVYTDVGYFSEKRVSTDPQIGRGPTVGDQNLYSNDSLNARPRIGRAMKVLAPASVLCTSPARVAFGEPVRVRHVVNVSIQLEMFGERKRPLAFRTSYLGSTTEFAVST